MCNSKSYLIISAVIAAALWFFMFSPWTAGIVNFWYSMTFSAIVLITLAYFPNKGQSIYGKLHLSTFVWGIGIAFALWVAFYVGDKVSQWMFDFARLQVNNIYDMKGGMSPVYIGLALLFIVGPAEEIFWRGYVQRTLVERLGKNWGFVVATLVYTLIHIWSMNFMLVMAAMVCGICWGGLYRLNPKLLPALVISHALWDTAAFVVFPF